MAPFKGIGSNEFYPKKKILALIKYKNKHKILSLFVLPDNYLPFPLLLGRDFYKCST